MSFDADVDTLKTEIRNKRIVDQNEDILFRRKIWTQEAVKGAIQTGVVSILLLLIFGALPVYVWLGLGGLALFGFLPLTQIPRLIPLNEG